jgi:hypothetical protein
MASSNDKIIRYGVIGLIAGVLAIGALIALTKGAKVAVQASRAQDTGAFLADLHRSAASGALKLIGPTTLEMAFMSANFPPKRPMPVLAPRARLAGGSVVGLADKSVALAHYTLPDGQLTVFTLPQFPDAFPEDAARVVRHGTTVRMVRRADVTLVLWRDGHWITAVASTMPNAELDGMVDLVRSAQGL